MGKRWPDDVAEVVIFPSQMGFRYTGRNAEGRVIYDSPRWFRSRKPLKEEIARRWPEARVSYGTR